MSFTEDHKLSTYSVAHLTHVISHFNAGIWEFNINTNDVKWSAGFYQLLGYEPGEIDPSYSYFYDHLLYHGDRSLFLKSIRERANNISTVHIRLLTKNSGYQWFENKTSKSNNISSPVIYGTITNIHSHKLSALLLAKNEKAFEDAGKIAKIAIWEIDVSSMNLTLSKEGYDIFELSHPDPLSVTDIINSFEPEFQETVNDAIFNIIKFCKVFDLELPFKTTKSKLTWLRFKAIPIIDSIGKCITVRGILQDINCLKQRETELKNSVNLINDKNKRLQNFAYIVSHNLRSHTGNLQFMVNSFNDTTSEIERDEIFSHIKSISEGLNITVKHLEEVVKIQAEINKEKRIVKFEPLFKNIINVLESNITSVNAKIDYNFSLCPEIEYIPAYLESIFQNLLTNSLKYRHGERQPVIKCHTTISHNHVYLIFEDNGVGIDLNRHGEDIFGMYKTFHKNKDSQGIGLFITRSQVESLGGSIKIDSIVNTGTRFTIRLN